MRLALRFSKRRTTEFAESLFHESLIHGRRIDIETCGAVEDFDTKNAISSRGDADVNAGRNFHIPRWLRRPDGSEQQINIRLVINLDIACLRFASNLLSRGSRHPLQNLQSKPQSGQHIKAFASISIVVGPHHFKLTAFDRRSDRYRRRYCSARFA